jgi:predicted dehydrogenase
MGSHNARVFARCEGTRVVGVLDTNPVAAARVAATVDAQAFASVDSVFADADLVVVATPIDTHKSIALRALLAGCAVLVEKPLCASSVDAHALVAAADRAQRRLFVGHSERFNPVTAALFEALRGDRVLEAELWRLAPHRGRALDHGVCINLAVHDVDLAAMLFGAPAALVRAEGHDGAAMLHLACKDGRVATVHASQVAAERVRKLRVVSERHVFVGDLVRGTLLCDGGPVAVSGDEALLAQARAVLSALAGRDTRCAAGVDGAAAVALVEEAARWLERPSRVSVISP